MSSNVISRLDDYTAEILTGNPMRTLRSSLVHGPTPALLKYLRSRLPKDEESEACAAVKEDVVTRAARLSIGSKELSLAGQGLGAVPSEIWKSSDITKVDLSGNSIEELPRELGSCVSLEALILSKNKIKEWPAAVLASFPRLLCLKLDGNPLRKIPSDGFQAASKLQILDLSGTSGPKPKIRDSPYSRWVRDGFGCNPVNLNPLPLLDRCHNLLSRRVRVVYFSYMIGQTDADINFSFGHNDFTTVTDS
ncbi:UNVERIFIED_CONTAM: Plant intracellular Ras-group-related LRR protein 6 [Sesamum latifolium]|uniref:Plant intracellular Ras-group-related LRR protein 6 n=1 Tax=Sesamum latifolium TaxID=2727402 RepID=A0AAW2TPN7_9LAMI